MRRIFGTLLFILSVLFAAVRLAADWIGRTTVIDDAELLGAKARPMIDFITDQPAAWFYGVLAVLALIGLSLHIPPNQWRAWLGLKRSQYPLEFLGLPAQPAGAHEVIPWILLVTNVSESTVRDISVILEEIKAYNRWFGFNQRFKSNIGPIFSLRPGERAHVFIAEQINLPLEEILGEEEPTNTFRIGPTEKGEIPRGYKDRDDGYVSGSLLHIKVVGENIQSKSFFVHISKGGGFGFGPWLNPPKKWTDFLRALQSEPEA